MRKIAMFAVAVAMSISAGSASAAGLYNNIVANVGGTFGNTDPTKYPPLFNDIYNFTTSFDRDATVEITSSMTTPKSFDENVNFVSNGVKLDAKIVPVITSGQTELRYLANFRIPAGVHNILVRGSAGENGQYAGVLTLAGVPEPSTWALMILGFGLTGAAMRRRSTATKLATA